MLPALAGFRATRIGIVKTKADLMKTRWPSLNQDSRRLCFLHSQPSVKQHREDHVSDQEDNRRIDTTEQPADSTDSSNSPPGYRQNHERNPFIARLGVHGMTIQRYRLIFGLEPAIQRFTSGAWGRKGGCQTTPARTRSRSPGHPCTGPKPNGDGFGAIATPNLKADAVVHAEATIHIADPKIGH